MESFLLPIALVYVPKQMELWKVLEYQKWGLLDYLKSRILNENLWM